MFASVNVLAEIERHGSDLEDCGSGASVRGFGTAIPSALGSMPRHACYRLSFPGVGIHHYTNCLSIVKASGWILKQAWVTTWRKPSPEN